MWITWIWHQVCSSIKWIFYFWPLNSISCSSTWRKMSYFQSTPRNCLIHTDLGTDDCKEPAKSWSRRDDSSMWITKTNVETLKSPTDLQFRRQRLKLSQSYSNFQTWLNWVLPWSPQRTLLIRDMFCPTGVPGSPLLEKKQPFHFKTMN